MFVSSGLGYPSRQENEETDINWQPMRNDEDLGYSQNSEDNIPQIQEQALVLKIASLMHQLVNAREKVFLYSDLCSYLRKENDELSQKLKIVQSALQTNNYQQQQNVSKIQHLQAQKQELANKLAITEEKISKLEHKLIEMEAIKDKSMEVGPKLKKKLKQISKINQLLEKELESANSKILELERNMEQKNRSLYLGGIQRLRESNMNMNANTLPTHDYPLLCSFATEGSYAARSRVYSVKNYRN